MHIKEGNGQVGRVEHLTDSSTQLQDLFTELLSGFIIQKTLFVVTVNVSVTSKGNSQLV